MTVSDRAALAFVALVAERGYENVELSEVSERASLEHGAAEAIHPTRLELFHAGWDLLEGLYLAQVLPVYESRAEWRSGLRAVARMTAGLLEEWPKEAHFMAVDALSVGREGRERQQELAARLATLLDEARRDLADPGSAPPTTSSWVVGLFFDRAYRYLSTGREELFRGDLPDLMFLAVSAYFGPDEGLKELRERK